jgi:hypothetical protein
MVEANSVDYVFFEEYSYEITKSNFFLFITFSSFYTQLVLSSTKWWVDRDYRHLRDARRLELSVCYHTYQPLSHAFLLYLRTTITVLLTNSS